MEGTAINQEKGGSNNISNNDVKRHPFDSTISSWGSDESSTVGFNNKAFDMLNSLRADIGQMRKDNEAVKTENKLLLEKNNTLTAKVDLLQAQNGELLARLKTVELLAETNKKLDSEQIGNIVREKLKAHVEEQGKKVDAQLELLKGKMAEESAKLQKEFRKLTLENQQKYSGLQMSMSDKNKTLMAQLEQQQMMVAKQQQQLADDSNSVELSAKVAALENQMATMRMDALQGPQVQQQQDQQQQDLDFAENNVFVDQLMDEAVAKKGEDEGKEAENEEENEDENVEDSPSSEEEEDEDDTKVDDEAEDDEEDGVDDEEEGNDEAVDVNEEADDDEEGEEEHGNGKEEKKYKYRGRVVALLSDVQPPRTVTSRKREFNFMDVTMQSSAALKANVLSRFGYYYNMGKGIVENCDQITMYCYGCSEHKSCRNNGKKGNKTCTNLACKSALLARKTDRGRFHLYRSGPHTCIRARKENINDVAGGSQQQQHDNNSRGAGDRGVGGMTRGAAKKTTTPHRR